MARNFIIGASGSDKHTCMLHVCASSGAHVALNILTKNNKQKRQKLSFVVQICFCEVHFL